MMLKNPINSSLETKFVRLELKNPRKANIINIQLYKKKIQQYKNRTP